MLLPFGTIAPGLLLPLLAFAYMLFFGSFMLPKKAGDDRAGDSAVHIYDEPGESQLNSAAPFFSNLTDDTTDPCLEKSEDRQPVDRPLCIVIKIPREDIVSDTHLLPCFARPPPAAAKA